MRQFYSQNHRFGSSLFQHLIAVLYLVTSVNPVTASTVVKQAEIYKIRNQVDINLAKTTNWHQAKPGDVIVPRDAVRTGANSRADILFNEGTLVRTGAGTTFRFPPGKRNFELTSGAAIIMIRPGQGQSIINTPEAKITTQGTALFVQHNPANNSSLIGVLTDSPAGLVEVKTTDGKIILQLQAGQFVSIVQGVVGLVEHFVLPMFYETVELASGLGMEPEAMEALLAQEPAEVQATIRAVQTEAIAPLQNQLAWLEGFCKLRPETQKMSSLLQLWGIVSVGELESKMLEKNLSLIPFRSLGAITWLEEYCQENSPRQL